MNVLRLLKIQIARRDTSAWITAASAVAVAIAIATWQVGVGVIPVAFAAEDRLAQFRELPLGDVFEGDTSAIENLQREIEQIKSDITPASAVMRWVGHFAPAVSWLPFANQEVQAWSGQVQRVKKDVEAASLTLDASSQLLELYSEAQSLLLDPNAGASISEFQSRIKKMSSSFALGLDAIREARQAEKGFGIGLQASRVRTLRGLLSELEGQVFVTAELGQQVSSLMLELLEVGQGIQPLTQQFLTNASSEESITLEEMEASLISVTDHSLTAKLKLGEVSRMISDTGYGTQLEPRLDALDQLLDVLLAVSRSGGMAIEAMKPALELAQETSAGLLSSEGVLVQVLDAFAVRHDELIASTVELRDAQAILSNLSTGNNGGIAPGSLSFVADVVGNLQEGLSLLTRLAPLGRDLLGANEGRKYLVLGQSADELRATGGFVSAVWEISVEGGGLSGIQYRDAVRVDDWARLQLYPPAPLGLEEHMNGFVWLMRDVSWDPDFPTTARTASDIYRLGQRQEVDGVIAINQWALLRLIEALGDIPSPDGGEIITSRNLLSVLEQGTDQYGRAYMDLVLQGVIDNLDNSVSLPRLMRLASALLDTLENGELLLFFDDPVLQAQIASFGWDGGVKRGSSDYLYVVDSNVGWSKVDRNIQRDIVYEIDLRKISRPRASLTLGYTNHSGPGSPGCEPQWRNRGKNYSQLKNACYWDFLRVYMPNGVRLLSSTPLPLPEYTVSVEIGKGVAGQETGAITSSHSKTVFSGLMSLESGERKEINIVYDLPQSIISERDGRLIYELIIQKQPGVRQRQAVVSLIPPEGYGLASSSLSPSLLGDGSRLEFTVDLTRNVALTVEFDRISDGSN